MTPEQKRRARKLPPDECQHQFIFDIIFSFENGEGELEVCKRCGERRRVDREEHNA